jgi:hypothetical protein
MAAGIQQVEERNSDLKHQAHRKLHLRNYDPGPRILLKQSQHTEISDGKLLQKQVSQVAIRITPHVPNKKSVG